jgi:hypothetical protein
VVPKPGATSEFICELHASFLEQGATVIERVIQEKADV